MEDLEIFINENKAVITSDKLPVITGSKVQMRQVFSNLIVNAIKYSKQDITPSINIIYTNTTVQFDNTRKKYYKVSITDNGIGMDSQYIGKIFTIFQRLHLRTQYSGNGIGLAICKKIMDNHSGHINAESSINEGSTFNLYFPA